MKSLQDASRGPNQLPWNMTESWILTVARAVGARAEIPATGPDTGILVETQTCREELTRADSKAQILLGAAGVAFAALLAGLIAGDWTPFRIGAQVQWLWWAGIISAIYAIINLGRAVLPRVNRAGTAQAGRFVGYFGDVVAYSSSTELAIALRNSSDLTLERIADQLLQTSIIAMRKYSLIRFAMLLFLTAAACCLASISLNALLVR
jgi:hypothetical protein